MDRNENIRIPGTDKAGEVKRVETVIRADVHDGLAFAHDPAEERDLRDVVGSRADLAREMAGPKSLVAGLSQHAERGPSGDRARAMDHAHGPNCRPRTPRS